MTELLDMSEGAYPTDKNNKSYNVVLPDETKILIKEENTDMCDMFETYLFPQQMARSLNLVEDLGIF